jgi:rubredoxin
LNSVQFKCKTTKKGGLKMDKYVCTICGYVYDPAQGDPDSGVDPGISWENVPEDWECPVCGASKEEFEIEG